MMAVLYGYEVYPDREIITKAAVAVSLLDEYTERKPMGNVNVSIETLKTASVKNPGGYYLFLDLADGEYRVEVEAGFYFPADQLVLVPLTLLTDITLKPKPSYPFPAGGTL
ncbi:MAG: hypothetical protein GY765_19210, partial [bacterium]|nr:hypothetical protein [bacterium]